MSFIKEFDSKIIRVKNKDTGAYVAISLGDLIYDAVRVDPRVAEGIDFSRKESLTNVLSLSDFVYKDFKNRNESSLEAINDLYKGYSFERIIAFDAQKNGAEVEFPEKSNQPGYDLKINGEEFQIKIQDNGINLIESHFSKYPDVKVITNSEAAIEFSKKYPDLSHMVINSGYTHDSVEYKVNESLDALVEISADDNLFGTAIPELLGIVSIISVCNNSKKYLSGEVNFENTLQNIAIESAGKFGGAGIGAKIGSVFGPIGTLVGGAAGYFVGGSVANAYKIKKFCKRELNKVNKDLDNYIMKSLELMNSKNKTIKNKNKLLEDIMTSKGKDGKKFLDFFNKKIGIEISRLENSIHRFEKYIDTIDKKLSIDENMVKFKHLSPGFDISSLEEFTKFVKRSTFLSERAGIKAKYISKEFNVLIKSLNKFNLALKKQGII